MQHLPRLAMTGQDTGIAMREVRVGLNLLDLLAYTPRVTGAPQALLQQVVAEVGEYFRACLKAGERLPAPSPVADDHGPHAPCAQWPRRRGNPAEPVARLERFASGAVARRRIRLQRRSRRTAARWSAPMIGDLDISGIFLPTLLVLMGITYVLFLLVHGVLTRLHFYRLVWHRALFNVALYAVLLYGVDSLSRYLMT